MQGCAKEFVSKADRIPQQVCRGILEFAVIFIGNAGGRSNTGLKDYFYYACKHRRMVDGHSCTYRKQWGEDRVNDAVAEIIRKLVQNPKFEEEIKRKIGKQIDTEELDKELSNMRKQMKQLVGAKNKLADQMVGLDIMDKHYDRKYQDMQNRMDKFYDEISALEVSIAEVENRMLSIRQQKISGNNVYEFLLLFDKLYDRFSDAEKKEFLKSFVEQVDLYEEEQPDGRFLKHIKFRFPVFYLVGEDSHLCRW